MEIEDIVKPNKLNSHNRRDLQLVKPKSFLKLAQVFHGGKKIEKQYNNFKNYCSKVDDRIQSITAGIDGK